MKKGRHVLDELSAYLDGEADDAEAIGRHLSQCVTCAQRFMELSKLSAHLKALPEAEPHPAFANRVMAHVQASTPTRRWGPVELAFVGTAVMVLLVASAAVYFTTAYSGSNGVRERVAYVDWQQLNPDALVEEIERRISEDNEIAFQEGLLVSDTESYLDETGEELMEILAGVDWLPTFENALDASADLDLLFMGLDETETEILRGLLVDYTQGG